MADEDECKYCTGEIIKESDVSAHALALLGKTYSEVYNDLKKRRLKK